MKRGKKILLIIGIAIGVLLLVAGGFALKIYFSTRDMTPAETSRINDTVFSLKDTFVNAFLFKHNHGYLMVDAGNNEANIKTQFEKLGISPADITTLLLTHTDGDHIAATGLFKNAKVYMHRDEEQMINGKNGKFPFVRFKWKFGPYTLLNSNDTLTIGGLHVKIIHTPGHTPGSCCYLINHDYLAVGDNLSYKNDKFGHFVDFFNMDTKQQEEAIKTLHDLKSIKYILTAHFGIIKN